MSYLYMHLLLGAIVLGEKVLWQNITAWILIVFGIYVSWEKTLDQKAESKSLMPSLAHLTISAFFAFHSGLPLSPIFVYSST